MVTEIDSFKEWFKGSEEQYTKQLGLVGRIKEKILEELKAMYETL